MTRRAGLVVAALTAVAVALRLPGALDSAFGDELSTYFIVEGHGLRKVIDLVNSPQEQTPPLSFALSWLFAQLGSDSAWLRVPAMLAGAATIPVVYLLGRDTVGRRAGLLAAAIATVHPFLLFYASEARAYALSTLFVLVATLAVVRALQGGGRRWWVVYAAAAALAMYSHYTAGFALIGQALWVLVARRQHWKPLLLSSVAAALAWAPWLPVYLATSDSPGARVIDAVNPFGFVSLLDDTGRALVGSAFLPLSDVPGTTWAVVAGAGALLALVAGGLRWRGSEHTGWLGLLVVCALAAPVLGAVVSATGPSVVLPRNLITTIPYAALVVAALVVAADRRVAAVALAALAAGLLAGTVDQLRPEYRRPPMDQAVRDVQAAGPPGTPVVTTAFPFGEPAVLQRFEVALHDAGLQDEYPVLRLGQPTAAADLRRRDDGPGQFTLIPLTDPAQIAREAVRDAGGGPIVLVDSTLYARSRTLPADNAMNVFLRGLRGYRATRIQRHPGLVPISVITFRRR